MRAVGLSLNALEAFAKYAIASRIEVTRVARVGFALRLVSTHMDTLSKDIGNSIKRSVKPDGGWSDPEETAWATSLLSVHNESEAIHRATRWMSLARSKGGGWGRHPRDQVRIITTALVIALVPEVAREADWAWLRAEWARDMERPVKLSYKGGFYLLAEKKDTETPLPDATIRFLEQDQNDDGGFGPWKDHPIGSDPWSTGVVLWGLSRWIDRVDKTIVEKALSWLERTQLPSGHWPYHYLDEGTSYALIGAVSTLKTLQRL